MQAQHQQLHTHEKILRYELQQKRKMLQELKQELEYCREKWESARQKNTNTEIEWRNLRREFAARKALAAQELLNTSGESGFSDERGDDSDEEDKQTEERTRTGPRRRTRKENLKIQTSDTDSEQPTDTEISETNIELLNLTEQQTSTSKLEESIKINELNNQQDNKNIESINPLDQALTNVIENLINIDDNNSSINNDSTNLITSDASNKNIQCENDTNVSVFSIGPFPQSTKMVQFNDPLVVGPSIQTDENIENKIDNFIFDKKDNCLSETKDNNEEKENNENKEIIENTKKIVDDDSVSSGSTSLSKTIRTPEEVLAARSERLKRLEEQADWLMKKMNATNRRGSELSNRLEELHETYGDAPVPPPMPDILPIVRLPTVQEEESRTKASTNKQNEQS